MPECERLLCFMFYAAALNTIRRFLQERIKLAGEALSKTKQEASLASLSWNSSRAPTEWSAIFAFGVFRWLKRVSSTFQDFGSL